MSHADQKLDTMPVGTAASLVGVTAGGLPVLINPVNENLLVSAAATVAANAAVLTAKLDTPRGDYFIPGSSDITTEPFTVGSEAKLTGNKIAALKTQPLSGTGGEADITTQPYACTFTDNKNGGVLSRLRMLPASGAAAHNGIKVGLANNIILDDLTVSGFTTALTLKQSTAVRVLGGAYGGGCVEGIKLTGATNDCFLLGPVVAYPTSIGINFDTGAQCNTLLGGESAVADAGLAAVRIHRANSTSVIGHNTESQSTGGTPATFYQLGDPAEGVATHNTWLKNLNIVANKGDIANAIEQRSPLLGFDIEQVRVNATKITNAVVKFFTTNNIGKVTDINVANRPGGVVDIEVASESGYFAGAKYTLNMVWEFWFNRGIRTLIAGAQARTNFPSATPAAVHEIVVGNDANLGVYGMRTAVESTVNFYENAKTGGISQVGGTEWRDRGIVAADPSSLVDGDRWLRSDTSPPELRFRIGGATYKQALTAA